MVFGKHRREMNVWGGMEEGMGIRRWWALIV
jgi:hypothetical protein